MDRGYRQACLPITPRLFSANGVAPGPMLLYPDSFLYHTFRTEH
jgi:hypothetical protein